MYRCFGCDSPAQYNCACYTQTERPENYQPKMDAANDARINIASGEDAMAFQEETEDLV